MNCLHHCCWKSIILVFWSLYSIPFIKLIIFILNFLEYCSFTLRLKSGTADFPTFFFLVIVVYFFLDSCIFTYTSELAYKFINTKCFLGFWFRSHLIYRSILRDLVLFLCEHHETLELSRSLIQQCLLVFCFIPDLRGEGFSISSSNTGISCFVTLHFIAFFYKLKVCVKQVSRCHFSKHISHFVFL